MLFHNFETNLKWVNIQEIPTQTCFVCAPLSLSVINILTYMYSRFRNRKRNTVLKRPQLLTLCVSFINGDLFEFEINTLINYYLQLNHH